MICPECGAYVADQILQGEARLLVHRWLRHQPPVVQAVGSLAATIAVGWVVSQAFGSGRGRRR